MHLPNHDAYGSLFWLVVGHILRFWSYWMVGYVSCQQYTMESLVLKKTQFRVIFWHRPCFADILQFLYAIPEFWANIL